MEDMKALDQWVGAAAKEQAHHPPPIVPQKRILLRHPQVGP